MNHELQTYPLNQLYFYLTEGCNLRCRHCWIAPKFQDKGHSYPVLSLNLFKSIIKQAKPLGLSGVKLTGGEPLLHPGIDEILEYIKNEGLDLTLETNGVLCTPEIARKIGACKDPFVSVSLDGPDQETHEWVRGVPGCFEMAIDGIKNLVRANINPQIIMTIMRRNKDRMAMMVHLAEVLGAESVKFNLTMPMKRGEKLHEKKQTLSIEELVSLGFWVENDLSASTDLHLVYDHPIAFRPMGKMFGDHEDGCSTCGILGILGVLSNGSYALCGIGTSVSELIFGHSTVDRLENVWNTADVLNQLRSGLTGRLEGICGDCLMNDLCLGSCIAQNYYQSRNLWAPFWYCGEAAKAGLFPGTRRRSVIGQTVSDKESYAYEVGKA